MPAVAGCLVKLFLIIFPEFLDFSNSAGRLVVFLLEMFPEFLDFSRFFFSIQNHNILRMCTRLRYGNNLMQNVLILSKY